MTAPVPPGNDNPGDATGDDSGQGSGSGDEEQTDNHPETVHLSVTRIGDGGVVYVDELCCALPYEADYAYGTTVKLAASYNQNWYFKKWSDGSTNSVKTVELTEDTNLEIEFFFDDSDDLDDNIK